MAFIYLSSELLKSGGTAILYRSSQVLHSVLGDCLADVTFNNHLAPSNCFYSLSKNLLA